jgi:hypothetical protein
LIRGSAGNPAGPFCFRRLAVAMGRMAPYGFFVAVFYRSARVKNQGQQEARKGG